MSNSCCTIQPWFVLPLTSTYSTHNHPSPKFTSFSKFEIWSHNLKFSRRECNKSASARSNLWRNELFSAFKRDISAFPWRSERSHCILKFKRKKFNLSLETFLSWVCHENNYPTSPERSYFLLERMFFRIDLRQVWEMRSVFHLHFHFQLFDLIHFRCQLAFLIWFDTLHALEL